MKPKQWFRAKRYGYGWTPNTWQGWTCVAVYVAWILFLTRGIDWAQPTPESINSFFVPGVLIGTAVLVFISWKKGAPVRWHWGD